MPLTDIRPIGYAAEDSDGGERHVAWRRLECPDGQVEVTGWFLVGLIEGFRRGQVDFVQVYGEERWGEVLAPRTASPAPGFQQISGT